MHATKEAGLRSDGELVQAATDEFDFDITGKEPSSEDVEDKGHGGWIDIADVGPPILSGSSGSGNRIISDTPLFSHDADMSDAGDDGGLLWLG